MRPAAIVQFERALLAALTIDLIANLLSWQAFAARFTALGVAHTAPLVLASCLASPLIGLLLWYFIARRRSMVAKWLMTVLIAIGVALLVNALAHPVPAAAQPLLAAAAIAEALKAFAVTRLFRRDAIDWFARGAAA